MFAHVDFFFRLCLRLLLFASLRTIVIRTLNDLYCPYFSSEAIVKLISSARGPLVALNKGFLPLIDCNPGHIFSCMIVFVHILRKVAVKNRNSSL